MRCLGNPVSFSPAVSRARSACAAFLIALLVLAAGIAAPNSPLRARQVLSGSNPSQNGPVFSGLPALQTNPVAQAATDLPAQDATTGTLAGEAGVDGGAGTYSVPIV